jgi:hypothetical protein
MVRLSVLCYSYSKLKIEFFYGIDTYAGGSHEQQHPDYTTEIPLPLW